MFQRILIVDALQTHTLKHPRCKRERLVGLNYLHQNPVEQGWVNNEEDYVYSSAKDYAGEKGLLEIEKIE